jgi:outer membrane biosynthesis protein TonB
MKTLKKHKYKILLVLILLVALGGGAAYYFKQKEVTKKAEAEKVPEENTAETQPKEPAVIEKPIEDPKEKQIVAKQKDLVLNSKGNQQLAKV